MHTGMADYRTLDRPICGDEFPASTGSERLHGTDATRLLFPWAERQFTWTKIAIEQLRNFFSRAWLSDLIQRPEHMFFNPAVRLGDLSKVRLSGLKVSLRVSLMGAAHTVRNVVRNIKGAPEPQGS